MLSVVGCHAEGEIGDVIVGGFLPPPGATMYERMRAMERDFDHVRRFLLCEPRGSVCRHVNLLTPAINSGCSVGVIIMEPTEYVPMSGSNLICTVTVILETGIVPINEPETIVWVDTPAGPVKAVAECRDGRCRSVEFENVPSFVDRLDAAVEVAGLGTIDADVAYGGMFYAIVDATKLGFSVDASEARELAVAGEKIRLAAREQLDVFHPDNPGIRGVSIVQLNRPFRRHRQSHAEYVHRRAGQIRPEPDRNRHRGANGRSPCPRPDGRGRDDDSRIADRLSIPRTHRPEQRQWSAGPPSSLPSGEGPGSPDSAPIFSIPTIPTRRVISSLIAGV